MLIQASHASTSLGSETEEVLRSSVHQVRNGRSQEKSENLIDAVYFCEQQLGGHLFSFIPPREICSWGRRREFNK